MMYFQEVDFHGNSTKYLQVDLTFRFKKGTTAVVVVVVFFVGALDLEFESKYRYPP